MIRRRLDLFSPPSRDGKEGGESSLLYRKPVVLLEVLVRTLWMVISLYPFLMNTLADEDGDGSCGIHFNDLMQNLPPFSLMGRKRLLICSESVGPWSEFFGFVR